MKRNIESEGESIKGKKEYKRSVKQRQPKRAKKWSGRR